MIKIVICDDDENFIHQLHQILDKYFLTHNEDIIIEEYTSGEDFIYSNTGVPDIAFLDVEMRNINGIQVGYEIQKRNSKVSLFIITSHSQYLDDAMDLRVFRYLEKPVDQIRLYKSLDLLFRKSNVVRFISNRLEIELREDEIVCIYASLRKTSILTDKGEVIYSTTNIKQWKKRLNDSDTFSSPHYSYIVNLNFVSEIDDDKITMQCKTGKTMCIYASRRNLVGFKKDFYNKMREYK